MIEKIQITDFTNPKTSIYNSRSETELFRMNEPKPGLFIAETELVIRRALKAGYVPVSMLVAEDELKNLSDLINECDNSLKNNADLDNNSDIKGSLPSDKIIEDNFSDTDLAKTVLPVYYAGYEHIKNLVGFPLTRGVCCAMRRKKLPDINTVLENASNIAVLWDIENPTNIGTIFRNAAALNIDAVILSDNSSDPLYRRSLRAGMGCQFSLPWTFSNSLSIIKEKGFHIAALALSDNSVGLSEFALKNYPKKALLLGNEGKGLPDEILKLCDSVVKIPMREGIDSLNVAVASGIAFYELCTVSSGHLA